MKNYRGIMLDVDNTLLDFTAAERTGIYEVLRSYGVRGTSEMLDQYSRINDSLWKAFERGEIERQEIMDVRFARFFQEIGLDEDGKEAEARYRAHLDNSAVPVPYAQEILLWLGTHYPLYVVTNGTAKTQYSRLAKSGFDKYFRDIFVSEDAGCQKPRKEFFDYCFARIAEKEQEEAVRAEDYLIVGDSLTSDILGGIQAGMDTCWFCRGDGTGTEGIVPDYVIHDLKELKDILL